MRRPTSIFLKAVLAFTFGSGLVLKPDAVGMTVRDALKQPDSWFRSAKGREALENVLSHQSSRGDWPKNQNTSATRFPGAASSVQGTFDNGATTGELRLLARALAVTNDARFHAAFFRGLDHILAAQYTNGGWPQYSPPPARSYHRHITFNDDAMLRLMEFLRDVASMTNNSIVTPERRRAARLSFDLGIDCILKCQVRINGTLTVWCAQHDEVTLEPRPARAFELAALSGAESAGLLLLLMSLESPSPEIIRSILAGTRWFQSSRLDGLREVRVDGDKRIVPDAAAPPLWARFYDIEKGRPIFAGRDGVKRHDYAEIESERRNGYAWYGTWGTEVLSRHPAWRRRWPDPIPAN